MGFRLSKEIRYKSATQVKFHSNKTAGSIEPFTLILFRRVKAKIERQIPYFNFNTYKIDTILWRKSQQKKFNNSYVRIGANQSVNGL